MLFSVCWLQPLHLWASYSIPTSTLVGPHARPLWQGLSRGRVIVSQPALLHFEANNPMASVGWNLPCPLCPLPPPPTCHPTPPSRQGILSVPHQQLTPHCCIGVLTGLFVEPVLLPQPCAAQARICLCQLACADRSGLYVLGSHVFYVALQRCAEAFRGTACGRLIRQCWSCRCWESAGLLGSAAIALRRNVASPVALTIGVVPIQASTPRPGNLPSQRRPPCPVLLALACWSQRRRCKSTRCDVLC